jgi:hypothetical protein
MFKGWLFGWFHVRFPDRSIRVLPKTFEFGDSFTNQQTLIGCAVVKVNRVVFKLVASSSNLPRNVGVSSGGHLQSGAPTNLLVHLMIPNTLKQHFVCADF